MTTVLISAGDASGDLHAAGFARAFRARHPEVRLVGMGGAAMREAGVDVRVDARDLAAGGLVELATQWSRIGSVWRRMNRLLRETQPDLVVLVDSGGFNIPFAKRVRRNARARILYYVAPQVWAWRKRRIDRIARRVDEVAVIFPFEPAVYAERGAQATFVGHPLVEDVDVATASLDRERIRRSLAVAAARVIAVFPGSRRNEVARQLPVQLEACFELAARQPRVQTWVVRAPSIEPGELAAAAEPVLRMQSEKGRESVRFVDFDARTALAACDLALVKPGTITLEAALLGRPMVVIAKVNPVTALLVRRLVALSHYAMPNLLAEEAIVPELVQEAATPGAIAAALETLFDDAVRERQSKALAAVAAQLAGGGAAQRVCDLAEKWLANPAN